MTSRDPTKYMDLSDKPKYYRDQFHDGIKYQDFVSSVLQKEGIFIKFYNSMDYQNVGESNAGIEVKLDKNFRATGNLYIEIAEKSDPKNNKYVASGIFRNDNTWLYAIGDYDIIFLLSKKQLKLLYATHKLKEVETSTSQGFLLPVKEAYDIYSLKEINVN